MAQVSLGGGFKNPAIDSAVAFRSAIDALSRPGTIQPILGALPPAPMSVAAGTLLLTLVDSDTKLCLQGQFHCEPIIQWLRFHTGAQIVSASEADFVLTDWQQALPLSQFKQGNHEYPDRSATLIIEMQTLGGKQLKLTGPGIESEHYISLPAIDALQQNHARYPLGVDFYLTCNEQVAALPRSTKVEEA